MIEWGIGLRDQQRRRRPAGSTDPWKRKLAAIVKRHPEWYREVLPLVDSLDFGRGFVERVTLPAQAFLERAPALYSMAPILDVKLTQVRGRCDAVAASSHLERLRSLDLSETHLDDRDVVTLTASPHLHRLRWLSLARNHISQTGLEAFAAASAKAFPSLQYLGFALNDCPDPTDGWDEVENGELSFYTTTQGRALEAKYGPLRWLHFRAEVPDPECVT